MRVDRVHRPDAIKVLIAEVPALLAEVVRRTVDEQPDMQVVAQVGSPAELQCGAAPARGCGGDLVAAE